MRFRLDRVLRLRNRLRRQAQDEAAQVGTRLATLRDAIAGERAAQGAARAAEEEALSAGVGADDVVRARAWEAGLREHELDLGRQAGEAEQALDAAREALVARRRAEEQLARLRERAADRERQLGERAAAALIDDLVRRPNQKEE